MDANPVLAVRVRRMQLQDVEQVSAIDGLSFSLPWPERSYRFEVTENGAARAWVAEVEGQLAGMLVLWLIVDEVHIGTIAVHPDFRQRGVAQRLLADALLAASEEGAVRVFLEVRRGNLAAQALYHKFGFVVDSVRPKYYRDNGEDALLMTLETLQPARCRQLAGEPG